LENPLLDGKFSDTVEILNALARYSEIVEITNLAKVSLNRLEELGGNHPQFWLALDALCFRLSSEPAYLEPLEGLINWSLELRQANFGTDSLMLCPFLRSLCVVYCLKKDFAKAASCAERRVEIILNRLDAQHPDFIDSLYILATIHHKAGNLSQSERLYLRILKNILTSSRSYTISLNEVVNYYTRLLQKGGRNSDALLLQGLDLTDRGRITVVLDHLSSRVARSEKTTLGSLIKQHN
jgi:tetratricopeptide (TPR) repeat protein